MSKIAFIVIAVLAFIASVSGTDKELSDTFCDLMVVNMGFAGDAALKGKEKVEAFLVQQESLAGDEKVKKVAIPIIKKLKAKGCQDYGQLEKAITDVKKDGPTSNVSQSAPSMMIAAFVVIAFLMN